MSIANAWPSIHCALLLAAALMGAGNTAAQTRWRYSPDGAEVIDNQTGLRWRRCSEGQMYSAGSCLGNAMTFTHEEALARAKGQTGWRLPNVKELSSIVDTDRGLPSIDVAVFPETPSYPYWSSSPYERNGQAWNVDFNYGHIRPARRFLRLQFRLVR